MDLGIIIHGMDLGIRIHSVMCTTHLQMYMYMYMELCVIQCLSAEVRDLLKVNSVILQSQFKAASPTMYMYGNNYIVKTNTASIHKVVKTMI